MLEGARSVRQDLVQLVVAVWRRLVKMVRHGTECAFPALPLQVHGWRHVTTVFGEMEMEHAQVFGNFDGRKWVRRYEDL
jgi:hypothetical protein